MNRRNIKTLQNLDFKTLADIAIKEESNIGESARNIYYDISKHDAIIYPEDDVDGLKIRPLYQRLLKDGIRLNKELSMIISLGIEYSLKTDPEQIKKDTMDRVMEMNKI